MSFRAFVKYWLPPLLWMFLIFGGSSDVLSDRHTSRFLVPMLRWFKPDISEEMLDRIQYIVRKGGHVTEYAILTALLWRAGRSWNRAEPNDPHPWRWQPAAFAIGVAALYAATDEFHQSFIPSRYSSPVDVCIDTAGACTAIVLIWLIGRWRHAW